MAIVDPGYGIYDYNNDLLSANVQVDNIIDVKGWPGEAAIEEEETSGMEMRISGRNRRTEVFH